MTRVVGCDFGKSYVKFVLLSFAGPGEAAKATVLRRESFHVDKDKVPRDAAAPLADWLVAKANQVPDQKPEQIAVTVPLPMKGQVYDSRKEWEFFSGKAPDTVEQLLSEEVSRRAGRLLPVRIMHDAESQICFVSQEYRPQGFYAVAAFGTSIAFAVAYGRGDDFEIGKPSSTFSHAVLAQDGPTCESCGRTCIGAAYKTERVRTDASVAANRRNIEVKAVCHAVSVLCALPLGTLYLTGGFLQYQEISAAIEQTEREMKYRSANLKLIPVDTAQFSGAIGVAHLLARSGKP